jgi:formylglycine-generating enzyme required for sulfatase activity
VFPLLCGAVLRRIIFADQEKHMPQPHIVALRLATGLLLLAWFVLPQAASEAQPSLPKTLANRIGMEFMLIPAGTFMMGSTNGEADERPVHQVTISRPFYLGKYEVTQAQWQAVMGNNPSLIQDDPTLPVDQVWWTDVQEFIRKLNTMEGGNKYRLPTEAEWEYAARAGSTTAYCFGDDPKRLGEYAWYKDNAGGKTHPVGQLKPNSWGLYDVHGNVWEWVHDWYGRYSSEPVTDPQGPSSGTHRMRRGCGWNNVAKFCTTTNRYSVAGYRDDFLGVRLLRTAP